MVTKTIRIFVAVMFGSFLGVALWQAPVPPAKKSTITEKPTGAQKLRDIFGLNDPAVLGADNAYVIYVGTYASCSFQAIDFIKFAKIPNSKTVLFFNESLSEERQLSLQAQGFSVFVITDPPYANQFPSKGGWGVA